jgi:hypothetical protein
MAKISMLALSLAFLFGCATTTPQEHAGMKKASEILGRGQATLQSLEKMMSAVVRGFGHICATVTDIYSADPEETDRIVACFDGRAYTHYRVFLSRDEEWYSVTPTEKPSGVSIEDYTQTVVYGQGFSCSKVTDLLPIKWESIIQVTCLEGKYKLATDKQGFATVTPW